MPVLGKDWSWFGALGWWQKALVGVTFGIALLLFFLLPRGTRTFVTIAAVASVLIGAISTLPWRILLLDRAWARLRLGRSVVR